MEKYIIIVLFISQGLCAELAAQRQPAPLSDFIPSENTDASKDFNNKRNSPVRKKISFIVKNDMKGFLYGNACMIEETHKMGFEYSVQIKGLPGSLSPIRRVWRNTGVYAKLLLTKGPWWKQTLNNRVRDCRKKSGDLVG